MRGPRGRLQRGRKTLHQHSAPPPNAHRRLHALLPGPWRDDLYDGPNLRCIEARSSRTADADRNAAPLECHDFPSASDAAVLIGTVPQGDQHMTVSRDKHSHLSVLFVPSALIAADRLKRVPLRERHDRGGNRLRKQSIEFHQGIGPKARREIPPIFLKRHRQRRNQSSALGDRHPRHQLVGTLGYPTLMDGVIIGSGAQVLGPIVVHARARIGTGCHHRLGLSSNHCGRGDWVCALGCLWLPASAG